MQISAVISDLRFFPQVPFPSKGQEITKPASGEKGQVFQVILLMVKL